MTATADNRMTSPSWGARKACLSCGQVEGLNGRRYCSIACRQRLRRKLNSRTGLLRALNARYATFYFTDALVVMDLVRYGSNDLFSFLYPRSQHRKPLQDFARMADKLGNAWWAERRRTNQRYLASRLVLSYAGRNLHSGDRVRPVEIRRPTRVNKPLVHLKMTLPELDQPRLEERIKRAFRQQAMRHHPDRGGHADTFRRIHRSYEELLRWAQNPTFASRRGFPDKWFYDGLRNRWVQPTPEA
jgi:hypothetical protein